MSRPEPPRYVLNTLETLRAAGYPAYPVGGCVRDMLLGVRPKDWDVCTAALPEQTVALFPHTVPTGIRHGTVSVMQGKRRVEVTTFRTDAPTGDHRHPESVRFVDDLREDLSRRDFTVNAMALDENGAVIDLFGGEEDLRRGLIRCVGEPRERFDEDALRMFRALRFSAQLGFALDGPTLGALRQQAPLAAALSPERIRDETEKTLLTDRPEILTMAVETGLLDRFLLRRVPLGAEEMSRLAALPKQPLPRWAAFCALLKDGGMIPSAEAFLRALRADNRTIRVCEDCCTLLEAPAPQTDYERKRVLHAVGEESALCFARCSDALRGGKSAAALRRVLSSGECWDIRALAVTGDDLLSRGLRGKELGDTLERLLERVMAHPEDNRRDVLLALAGRRGEE